MHISTKERICTVCGGPGAAYHYQGMVCQSCRVFFVRTIRRKVNVPCRNGDNACEIVAANCTACRFKKCLDANMKTGDVGKITSQHVRRAVVRYLTRNDYIVKIKEIQNNFGALGCQMLTRLYGTSLTDFLKHMIHFEKSITNLEGTIPTGSQVNPNVSLAELLSNPAACAPRDTAAWNTRLCKKPEEGDYLLIHMYTRFCVAIADFFSSIMEFHQLSSIDKLKLAQYHIGHVGSLDCIFYQFKFGVETASCVSKTEEYSLDDKEKAVWNERCHSATSYFNTAADIFEEIVITHEEIILLKLLMIFFAPENLSEEGKAVCRRARGKYQNMLAKYVTDEYPLMNKSEQLARISRILEIYPIMQNVSEDTGQKYVIIINNNIGGMKQQLPHDIRIKVYTVPDIMPKLKIQQIVSVSESDDKYGPKNLLLAKKWRGKAGSESNSVILRLEKEEEIRTIFIGNEGSAYISVAVAKSCEIMPTFNVLLSETAFMDPGECRMERNLQRVKSFDKSKLSSAFAYKKWDLIKVVCKQPYNKRIPFGISFITLIGGDENTEASSPTRLTSLGVAVNPAMPSTSRTFFDSMTNQQEKEKRKMEEEGREAVERAENTHIRREELMEKARQLRTQKRQAEVAIDAPSCSSANAIILDSKGRSAAHNTLKTPQTPNSTTPSRVLQGMINANNTTPTRGNGKKRTVLSITPKRRKNAAENGDDISESSSSSPPLSGVHLTLSGFENPLRGELREKACALGAVYSQDVNDRLTHLVSAFKNTPKAKKCRSTVKLVSRHWIERCFVERRRLNEDLFKF